MPVIELKLMFSIQAITETKPRYPSTDNSYLSSFSGGIFEHEFRGQEMVFKYAVEKVNSRRDILPYTKLTYDIQECPADDSFLAAKKGKINFMVPFASFL